MTRLLSFHKISGSLVSPENKATVTSDRANQNALIFHEHPMISNTYYPKVSVFPVYLFIARPSCFDTCWRAALCAAIPSKQCCVA